MFRALRHILCLAALLLAVPAGAAMAAEETLTIVFEEYPPYEYLEGETPRGINIEIIREAFSRMGVRPVFRTMPWKRGLYELKNGTIAALASGFRTPDREKFAYFPHHYLSLEVNSIFVCREGSIRVDSLKDLRGKTVGVVREYAYGTEFDTLTGMLLDPVNNNTLLVGKLADRRVDAIAGNLRVIEYLAERLGVEERIRPAYNLSSEPLYLFFSRKAGPHMPDLVRRYDSAMSAMEADGTLRRLRDR
ncbi:substrate-binding periplasmic protein [Salidesulfovibrio onnuriiensis]|uniref:substrate-binding periplasmic protein n=1 Tax=Salidesulfovibrio onnuriiensis TaxID=2583823 RepID=UPI0011C83D6B|nr:transporter substrate-binding domain-containing protein [Salidesulfovibrio onnuriiensis]